MSTLFNLYIMDLSNNKYIALPIDEYNKLLNDLQTYKNLEDSHRKNMKVVIEEIKNKISDITKVYDEDTKKWAAEYANYCKLIQEYYESVFFVDKAALIRKLNEKIREHNEVIESYNHQNMFIQLFKRRNICKIALYESK